MVDAFSLSFEARSFWVHPFSSLALAIVLPNSGDTVLTIFYLFCILLGWWLYEYIGGEDYSFICWVNDCVYVVCREGKLAHDRPHMDPLFQFWFDLWTFRWNICLLYLHVLLFQHRHAQNWSLLVCFLPDYRQRRLVLICLKNCFGGWEGMFFNIWTKSMMNS